ncbi:MAG: nucleolar DEAD-box protein required for synthesis of 60S ribosomal subunit [Peltula sp. TS41687]|nr:MAG: nucleolar DEAD-box protein required for synthesis of 60S ribosomal subunit [Peltula sp. TS41687]
MAATALSTFPQQDDFILTLPDDETGLGSYEDEDEVMPDAKSRQDQGLKRKRQSDSHADQASKRRVKKAKAEKTDRKLGGRNQNGDGKQPSESEKSLQVQIEDDGAIDSEFEFVNDDGDTGVIEDFDGWERQSTVGASAEGGAKRALGLEEIIARRRRAQDTEEGHAAKDKDDGLSNEDQDEQEETLLGEEEVDGFDGTEDELLAEDAFGMGAPAETDSESEAFNVTDAEEQDEAEEDASDQHSVASPMAHPDDMVADHSSDDDQEDDPEEAARQKAFFAPEDSTLDRTDSSKGHASASFQNMSLSRPVLRGLAAVGFSAPTPIQSKTIPVALLGKDVVGGAVTGSGKTAAFLVPIIERLLYRSKRLPTSRVAILMPTRELAVQCFNVAKKLASYTDISFCCLAGGFSLREQELELRKRPDVIIATPGRFIDHMRNSPSFTLDTLEILVLDEADRMLEDGFADELNEILTTIPKSRQTMLLSATMTGSVDKLIRVGMTRPVRLMVDARKQTVETLVQEFVRLRPGWEDKRLAYLMYLCQNVYTNRVIIFFRQKREAHRVRILFGLCGLKASELHGSMSQEQRIRSVEAFRDGQVAYLLATDLASRGLDIKGVETVINYEAPQSHEIYLHRVGRTARAGRSGRACTLAAEPDRKVVKAAVRTAKEQGTKVVSRKVDPGMADAWAKKIEGMQADIEEILKEEKEEKQLAQAEMQLTRGENLIVHKDDIMARPKRTWFESEKDKRAAKKVGRIELNGPEVKGKGEGKGKGKLSGKERKKLEDREKRQEGNIWKKTGKPGVETVRAGKGKKKQKKAPMKGRAGGKGK